MLGRTILSLLIASMTSVAGAEPLPKGAAAVVNGVPVPRSALIDVVQAVIAQLDDVPDTPTTEKYRRQALESLIDFELLYQAGRARQLQVPENDVKQEIERTVKSFPSAKDYEKALAAKGLTRKEVEGETRRALLVRRVLEDVVWPGVATGDAALQAYYDAHREDFRHPAQVRASYILVRVKPGVSAAAKKVAREEAEGLARRARAGEDFAALARTESDDPATSQRDGDLGFVSRGTMDEAFETVVFSLEPGQVSDVIETRAGYVVAKVTAKRDAGISSLAEVRDRVAGAVREQGRQKAQDEFVADLRAKAEIEIAPDLR